MNQDNYFVTDVDRDDVQHRYDTFEDGVVHYVQDRHREFALSRQTKEENWLNAWAQYLGSPEARNEIRNQVARTVGNVNTQWRHDLTTGKGFEIVETILSYFMSAFFPNSDWFDAVPEQPDIAEYAELIKQFTKKKLQEANFRSYWEMFLRQMLITGTSVIALPWRVETVKWKKKVKINQQNLSNLEYGQKIKTKTVTETRYIQNCPDFEVLDTFDIFLDPYAIDINKTDVLRRIIKTKAELMELVDSDYYKNIEDLEIVKTTPYNIDATASRQQTLRTFKGFNVEYGYSWTDKVELFEYWGDVVVNGKIYRDVVATVMGSKLLRFENNPYWCGKPFIIGTYIPVVRSTTALGALEPVMGLLHEFDIITNQRLDNLELSVDSMWMYINDGSLAPEDIYTEPGRVFMVNQDAAIQPIQPPQNFTITYDESSVLEQRIDRNTGTGNLISANAARDAERVTAAEIAATREAGGNRLTAIFKHVENTSMLPLLAKVFRSFQQFIDDDETIRLPGNEPGSFDYALVGAEELNNEYRLIPKGSDHVIDQQYEVDQFLNFLNTVSANPEMSQHIDFKNAMLVLARKMGIDDLDQIIKGQEEQPATDPMAAMADPTMPVDPMQLPTAMQEIEQTLGKPYSQSIQSQLQADGGQSMFKEAFGMNAPMMPQALPPEPLPA